MLPRPRTSTLGVLFAIAATGLLAGGSMSCAGKPDSNRVTEILQPDYPTYRDQVDAYIQRRCGTLDCHGQPGRAYRIYGYSGFRLYTEDAGLVSGQQATTEEETRANYQAAVALEPEEMSRLVATQGADPNTLLLLRKPLKLERHKGGQAMALDDAGYRCIVAWLRVRTIRPTADGVDFETIPQEEREQLSVRAKQACADAKDNK